MIPHVIGQFLFSNEVKPTACVDEPPDAFTSDGSGASAPMP